MSQKKPHFIFAGFFDSDDRPKQYSLAVAVLWIQKALPMMDYSIGVKRHAIMKTDTPAKFNGPCFTIFGRLGGDSQDRNDFVVIVSRKQFFHHQASHRPSTAKGGSSFYGVESHGIDLTKKAQCAAVYGTGPGHGTDTIRD